jgi:hypothetical protein
MSHVINSLNLLEPFHEKSSLLDSYITVRVSLFLKDPFILNSLAVARNIYQGPYLVVIHRPYFGSHGF